MKTFIVKSSGLTAQLRANKAAADVKAAQDGLDYAQHAVTKAQARLALAIDVFAAAEAEAVIYRVGTRTKTDERK